MKTALAPKRCEIFAEHRQYSPAGSCQKIVNVKRIAVGDVRIMACTHHRAMLQRGRPFKIQK